VETQRELGSRSPRACWPVMVLAYNEERHIAACLDSIFAAEPDCDFEVFVMANGCTDGTEAIVRECARRRPEIHLISIAAADKCNAWNMFVHEESAARCPDAEVLFFMNGDMRAVAGSFSVMARALRENPHANAASAVPVSGRTAARNRSELIRRRGLFGNLYSLRGSFVARLRELSVRMPLNLEDDDGLILELVRSDLAPDVNPVDHQRVAPCPDAAFAFDSLSPLRLEDWVLYAKRLVRYGRRGYENQLLSRSMRKHGISGMPVDIAELYHEAESLTLRWNGIYTLANFLALWRIRNLGKARRPLQQAAPRGPI